MLTALRQGTKGVQINEQYGGRNKGQNKSKQAIKRKKKKKDEQPAVFKAVPCKTTTIQNDAEFLQNCAGKKPMGSPLRRAC